jgi:hypothetical protein
MMRGTLMDILIKRLSETRTEKKKDRFRQSVAMQAIPDRNGMD